MKLGSKTIVFAAVVLLLLQVTLVSSQEEQNEGVTRPNCDCKNGRCVCMRVHTRMRMHFSAEHNEATTDAAPSSPEPETSPTTPLMPSPPSQPPNSTPPAPTTLQPNPTPPPPTPSNPSPATPTNPPPPKPSNPPPTPLQTHSTTSFRPAPTPEQKAARSLVSQWGDGNMAMAGASAQSGGVGGNAMAMASASAQSGSFGGNAMAMASASAQSGSFGGNSWYPQPPRPPQPPVFPQNNFAAMANAQSVSVAGGQQQFVRPQTGNNQVGGWNSGFTNTNSIGNWSPGFGAQASSFANTNINRGQQQQWPQFGAFGSAMAVAG